MRIVLLGDIHVYALAVWPWELLSKRLIGQLNLWFNRRRVFDMKRLPGVARRVLEMEPDALLCSGDLTTTAQPREFRRLEKILGHVFDQVPTFIVPGNHDRYTARSMRGRYLERDFIDHTADAWPHHRALAPAPGNGDAPGVELIGLDPTRPTPWFNASGALGDEQIERFEKTLAAIDPSSRVIVLCHYPIGSPPGHHIESFGHKLTDDTRLIEVLAAAPHRILYLHGHVHQPWCWRLGEPADNVVAVNAGAPIMADGDHPHGQGFWQIDIGDAPAPGRSGDSLALTHHVPTGDGDWRADAVAIPESPGAAAELP